eukprot:m.448316 g.448316  ORF g.448316 m.448316 type:complete len:211 (+) comp19644_c0_seq1:272-904(+)
MQRNDARTLSDALAIDNQLATAALDRVRTLKTKLTKATQCRESLNELNELGGRRPESVLTGADSKTQPLGLSDQWASDLHDDNTQLRATLAKFQAAIDLIMQKHRAQVSQFLDNAQTLQRETDAKIQAAEERNAQLEQHTQRQAGKIEEMVQVMCLAVVEDTKSQSARDTELQRLRTENEGLRQILAAAQVPSGQTASKSDDLAVSESAA